MATFELRKTESYSGITVDIVKIDDDGKEWLIPMDEGNSDYQQYLIDTDGGLSPERRN